VPLPGFFYDKTTNRHRQTASARHRLDIRRHERPLKFVYIEKIAKKREQGVAAVSVPTKPRVFVGCSAEAIQYARAVHEQLAPQARVRAWYAGVFAPGEYPMESLEKSLDASDFAVFIFAPDDVVLLRGKYYFQPRDNTLFEMGLFWGRLRRGRVFCVMPERVWERDDLVPGETVGEFRLLSDLQGLTVLRYDPSAAEEGDFAAAVDTACGAIIDAIQKKGLFVDPRHALEDTRAVLARRTATLRFLWEYIRGVTVNNEEEKRHAVCEAVRNSLLVPEACRVTGAALWQRLPTGHIVQVAGNVGKGRDIDPSGADGRERPSLVADTFEKGEWNFYERREIGMLYVLCYPLDGELALAVHLSADEAVPQERLYELVRQNEELLHTIHYLLGGSA